MSRYTIQLHDRANGNVLRTKQIDSTATTLQRHNAAESMVGNLDREELYVTVMEDYASTKLCVDKFSLLA